jgi:hypothetical protein
MKISASATIWTLAVVLAVLAIGFVIYPGGRGLVGDYRLVRVGDSYQLEDTRQPENQLGNRGAVVRIGWDDSHIVVNRLASPARDTPWSNEPGWVVIDVARHATSNVMTDGEIRLRTDMAQIPTYAPDSAYNKGHWW